MEFSNRNGVNLKRKRIRIVSQTPTEIIADIERADEGVTQEGTKIVAATFIEFENEIEEGKNLATNAKVLATEANDRANEALTNSQKVQEKVDLVDGIIVDVNDAKVKANEALDEVKIAKDDMQTALIKANSAEINCASSLEKITNVEQEVSNLKETVTNTKTKVEEVDGKTSQLKVEVDNLKVTSPSNNKKASLQGYTGGSSNIYYYPLAKLPKDDDANYASVIVQGRIGGWVKDNMSYISGIVSNRDGEHGVVVDLAANGNNALDICDLVLYRQEDNTTIVYLKAKEYFTFDIELETYQAEYIYDGNYTLSPSGVEKWKAANATNKIMVYGNNGYIGNKKISTATFSLEGNMLVINSD